MENGVFNMKRRLIKIFSCLLVACITVISLSTVVFADSIVPELTPREIDELLANVPAIEIEPGVYLRDNGVYSMYEIDASQFDLPETDENIVKRAATIWDLSNPYSATFEAKLRVNTAYQFKGYSTLYIGISLNSSIFPDSWTCGFSIGTNDKAFVSIAQYSTGATIKFTNINTTTAYYAFFAKGGSTTAKGTITVSK